MKSRTGSWPVRLAQVAVHLAAMVPLAVLFWDYAHDSLTVNPIQRITLWTGKWTLVLLVLSLACTPASSLFGFRPALRWRRPLGVYAFLYAALHFLTFVGLDYTFDAGLLREAIFEKRYALVGFAAFLILVPLAATSTRGWMRRLGRRWKRLHALVYLAAVLAVLHYTWSVKADIRVPLQYAAIVVILLAMRLPVVRHAVRRLRAARAPRALRAPRNSTPRPLDRSPGPAARPTGDEANP